MDQLKKNYLKSVGDGLLKIFSKMGISTLQSYQGSQIFEIVGINKMVVNSCFTGAISRIEGIGFDEIAKEALIKHNNAFRPVMKQEVLKEGGVYQWKRQENTTNIIQIRFIYYNKLHGKMIMKFSKIFQSC